MTNTEYKNLITAMCENQFFAYDGCHKIYIIENAEQLEEAQEIGYTILGTSKLLDKYDSSCPLRFVDYWDTTKDSIVRQKA